MNLISDTFDKIRQVVPNLAFIIRRSTNDNIVVYEANIKKGRLDESHPLLYYWLDIDKNYMRKRRHCTIMETKSPILYMEKGAYGFDVDATERKETFRVTMKAIPSIPIYLTIVNGDVVAKCMIQKNPCHLFGIYVEMGFLGPKYVILYGRSLQNYEHICEEKIYA